MNKQIKFQKILAYVSLVISALVFVFAIIFFSGNLGKDAGGGRGGILIYHSSAELGYEGADVFINAGQSFVNALVIIAIIYIVLSAFVFVTACHTRRNYYITNYICIGAVIAMSAFIGIFVLIEMCVLMGYFYGSVDWAGLAATAAEFNKAEVTKEPTMFIIGIVVGLLVVANTVAWVLNLIWKIKLMKGEKQLLENSVAKEVA